MKKPKYITAKNYLQFKPSEFVRSFVSDLEVAKKLTKRTGKPMNMNRWWPNENCLPCLGGMACMNMGVRPDDNAIGDMTSELGDNIRIGYGSRISDDILKLFKEYKRVNLPSFEIIHDVISNKEIDILIDRIHTYADLIEASGQ